MTLSSVEPKQNNCQALRVRLVADLSASAFRTRQTKELALWHCLRALNTRGTGQISVEKAVYGLGQYFGYSRRTIFRLLEQGEGVFWQRIAKKRGSVVKIYGLKRVCVMFDTPLFNTARFYEVPAEKFDTLKKRRLALWASVHKPKGIKANPISRASLEEYTGVQRRTQIRYDQEGPVRRTPNYRPQCEQKRLPNSYHNKQEPGHKGMLPRVRRSLKSFKTDEAKLEKRRYFGSIRRLLANKDRVDLSYLLTRSTERQIKGRLEWTPILSLAV